MDIYIYIYINIRPWMLCVLLVFIKYELLPIVDMTSQYRSKQQSGRLQVISGVCCILNVVKSTLHSKSSIYYHFSLELKLNKFGKICVCRHIPKL